MPSSLLKQSSIYSIGKLITTFTGLISFPILTKNLSIESYGLVALFTTTIGLCTSFNKVGLQHSLIRFYSQTPLSSFLTNILTAILFCLLTTGSIVFLIGYTAGYYIDNPILEPSALTIIVLSALLQSIQSYTINLMVSQKRSFAVIAIDCSYRLLSLSTVVITILYISATPTGFIHAIITADILLTIAIIIWLYKEQVFSHFNAKLIDTKLLKSLAFFGLPMMGYEFFSMAHAFIDRFIIEYYLGSENLGLYSAPYNIAMLIGTVLLGGLTTAIVPVYLQLWKEEGKKRTEELLTTINDYLLLLAPAIIVGLYVTSDPLIKLLATEAYLESAALLPIIAIGVILYNTGIIYAAGLQIKKDSKKIFQFILESTILNITLNLLLTPKYGLIAPAIITVISYLWMAIRLYLEGRKVLQFNFNFIIMLRSLGYSSAFYYLSMQVDLESSLLTLIARVAIGIITFLLFALLFETKLIKPILHRFSSRV